MIILVGKAIHQGTLAIRRGDKEEILIVYRKSLIEETTKQLRIAPKNLVRQDNPKKTLTKKLKI